MKKFGTVIRKIGLALIMLLIFAFFFISIKQFRSLENILNILRATSVMAIFTLALTVVMNAGEFDLSLVNIAAFSATVSAVALTNGKVNVVILWMLSAVIGLGLGYANGFFVTKIRIPAFIATLGMSSLLNGCTNLLTNGAAYYSSGWPSNLGILGRTYLFKLIPVPVIVLVIVGVVIIFFIEYTNRGRHIMAVGSNAVAAAHVGLNTAKIKTTAFAIAGLLASVAGVITWSLLGQVSAEMTTGFQMQSISAAFLGAVFLRDGIPNVGGSLIASLLLAIVSNGLTMLGIRFQIRFIVEGLILLMSVGALSMLKKGNLKNVILGL